MTTDKARTSFLRITTWWQYIVPPVYAFAYLAARQAPESLVPHEWGRAIYAVALTALGLSIIGTAGFGYFLNDLTDIAQDTAAGKPNQVARWPIWLRVVVPLILLVLAWGPWLLFRAESDVFPLIIGLLALEFLVFFLYSVPPIRLKEKGIAGIVCDTLYGHVIPVAIALVVFSPDWPRNFAFALPVMGLMGLRNILLHQIEDRHRDRRAGVNTFVRQYGPQRALNLINRGVLPLELGLLVLMLFALTNWAPWLALCFGLFLGWQFLLFNFLHWPYRHRTSGQRKFLFIYFLNDWYEEWMPVSVLVLLIFWETEFVWFLLVHLLIFPGFLANFIRDIRQIRGFFQR
ncbi:MAG: UbiA family prenyltransferase [Bacteroidota bacterium]